MEKKLRKQHVEFLRWMASKYGKVVYRAQFSEIGFESGHNTPTVWNYIKRLSETGCITVDVIDHYKRTMTLNIDRCNELLLEAGQTLLEVKE